MKHLFTRAILAATLVFACAAAHAADRYVLASPSTFSPDNIPLFSAQARGSFAKAGLDVEFEPTNDMLLVTQKLNSGALDAHAYPAPAFQANKNIPAESCATMIVPLAWKFYGAIIATVPTWKELVGGTVIHNGPGNFTSHGLVSFLVKEGVPANSYKTVEVGGFTLPRLRAMLKTQGPAVVPAFDPLYEYISRAEGVYTLAPAGTYPLVNAGVMVRCKDLQDPAKAAIHARFARVVADEIRWMLDAPKSDPVLIPWARAYLDKAKYEEKYGTTFEGLPVKKVDGDPAERLIQRARKNLDSKPPSKELMEHTIKVLFGHVPTDFSKYYHFDWMSQ